jgi:hypothetical protein
MLTQLYYGKRYRERERVRPLKAFSVAYDSASEIDDRMRHNTPHNATVVLFGDASLIHSFIFLLT